MYVVIFRARIRRLDAEYAPMAARMRELALEPARSRHPFWGKSTPVRMCRLNACQVTLGNPGSLFDNNQRSR
ncbi:MAG TPA: hypothetical protein VLH36_11550 [Steroidobacteraceae bacterium]|nr:hypothetical protein [Steroidobacteraceae bacterium]